MEDRTVIKLNKYGVLSGYNGFTYMCWILEHYTAYAAANLDMGILTGQLSSVYSVSKKAVLHNLTLLLEKSWNAGETCPLRQLFAFSEYMPTLKEFIATIIVITEYCA